MYGYILQIGMNNLSLKNQWVPVNPTNKVFCRRIIMLFNCIFFFLEDVCIKVVNW